METLGDGPAKIVDEGRYSAELSSNGVMHISPKPAQQPQQELIAGKFKSQDDLLKAYKELEAKLGAKPPTAEASPPASPPADPQSAGMKMDTTPDPKEGSQEEEKAAKAETDVSPLDFTQYSTEYFEKGELSEDSYKALEKDYRLPKDVVDAFVEGQQAILTIRGQALYEAAGGKEAYNALTAWGTASLPPEQRAAFNSAVDTAIRTGDNAAATLLIQALKSQMGGAEPRYVAAQNKDAGPAITPFSSRAEMTAAMRNPLYRTDPAYEQQVKERLRVSNF